MGKLFKCKCKTCDCGIFIAVGYDRCKACEEGIHDGEVIE